MIQEPKIQKEIEKIKQSKQFLTILILLFIVVFFWVLISLVTSKVAEKIDPELQLLAKPLNPVIETEVFDRISQKKAYTEEELSVFTIFKVLISSDGRTERIVPIEVNLEDIDFEPTPRPESESSLLEQF